MNLSKVLKQKRDEEDRLRNRSPQTVFTENIAGEQNYNNIDSFLKTSNIKQGTNVTIDIVGKDITINASGGGSSASGAFDFGKITDATTTVQDWGGLV
ncbi:MAG: hypothetical protein K0R54_2226 [Clostridiaceae bacterium]|jgi:hypothetical protein|nr:hypothetical protein [Clostridiaceae bacterium]